MKALILAAGKSTRIASVAQSLPKPLIPLDGQPVLAHNLALLQKHGVRDVWINLHYEPDRIEKAIGDGGNWGVTVRYSREKEILGTAGAVKNLEKELQDGPFLVLYGDNFTDCDITEMLKFHGEKRAGVTIAVFDAEKNPNSRIAGGKIELDSQNQVLRFLEGDLAVQTRSNWVNGGIYVVEPAVLGWIRPGFSDFGKDVFPALLQNQKKIYAYAMRGFCFAIDTPEAMKTALENLSRTKR